MLDLEEVELLYQKKSRMRIRPSTAVNAKITKSSVFTDRSSTIFSDYSTPVDRNTQGQSLRPRRRDSRVPNSWGTAQNRNETVTSRACSIALFPRVRHVLIAPQLRNQPHRSPLGVKASCVSEARCPLESSKMVSILGNRGHLEDKIDR